jgi:hypothetical protein
MKQVDTRMARVGRVVALSVLGILSCAGALAQTQLDSLNFLYGISGQRTVAGQQAGQYWETMRSITGKYPGLWGEDFSFSYWRGTSSLPAWRSLITSEAKQRFASGALVSLMFHACPPTQAEPCGWDGGVVSKLSDSDWNQLVTNGTALNNAWKARLDVIAGYLQDLETSGVEVLFRPFHEMNQGVFWWAGRPGANGTRRLYQITHDYLVNTKGLSNLVFVWDLQDFGSLSSDLTSYDPGSGYWDVLALDVYWSDGTGFTSAKYNAVVSKAGGKPVAIGECGSLPSASLLSSQPRWTFFMGWAELVQQQNTNAAISALYNAGNVATLDEMPGWGATPPPPTGTWYSLVNRNSGKCVDARASGTANGTVVQQYTCNSGWAQQFQMAATSGGYSRFGNRNASSQVLDVTGGAGATANAAKIQLWAWAGGTNQQWLPVSEGNGYYHLVARHSGRCLDVPGASGADSVQLQQWDCNGTGAQSFRLVQQP